MQSNSENKVAKLFNSFTEVACSGQSPQSQLFILAKIKSIIMSNPNNYYHPLYGKTSFISIYEFIIQSLSRQQHPSVLNFLLHVLAQLTTFWVFTSENIRKIYQGVLSLFQQRSFCGENCFRFLRMLVQAMQEVNSITHEIQALQVANYSMMPTARVSIENYFIYHMLNQFLAFSNIFLDRSVVRNQQAPPLNNGEQSKKMNEQSSNRYRLSHSFDRSNHLSASNSQQNSSAEQQSEACQLYKINQDESVILSILSLIRACLSYDFSHTSRHEQQSQYQPHKSPIILPTKYSKYSRFSQYDIFLKNQNTTQMINYLFLVCNNMYLKIEVLKILQSMARIHFRYFKNKTFHKLHLEDVGYVVANLLTGLDLNEPTTASRKGVQVSIIDQHKKAEIALNLGEIVNILLYHQPTFYIVENSLIQMIIEHLQTFIIDELLDPDYFDTSFDRENSQTFRQLSKVDICLLIQTYMGQLPKLKDNIKSYINSNESLNQKINQLFIRVGQKYFKVLAFSTNQSAGIKKNNKFQYSLQNPIPQQSSKKQQSINVLNNSSNQFMQKSQVLSKLSSQSDNQQTQTKFQIDVKFTKKQKKAKNKVKSIIQQQFCQNVCFLQLLVRQHGSIEPIRNLLPIFRVYCPRHSYFNQAEQNQRNNVNVLTSSDLSYCSQKSNKSTSRNKIKTNSKKKQKQQNKQLWLTSWLCSFQHHFHVTAGHSRHCQHWQIQLQNQLMLQLIQDLYYTIGKYISKSEHQLGQCILTAILYCVDKIQYDCRIETLQYMDKISFDIENICQFLVKYFQQQIKQKNGFSNKLTLMPIVDFLNNLNFHKYIKSQLKKQSNSNNYNQYLSILNTKYKQIIFIFCTSLSLFPNLTTISQHENLVSKILHVLLKFWMQINLMQQVVQFDKIIVNIVTQIFRKFPSILLKLLQQIYHFLHLKYRKDIQNMYLMVRNQCINLYSDANIMSQKLRQKTDIFSYHVLVQCMVLLIKSEQKMNETKFNEHIFNIGRNFLDIGQNYLSNIQVNHRNCQCTNFYQSYLKLLNELLIMNKTFSFTHFLNSLTYHLPCISFMQLQKVVSFVKSIISVLSTASNFSNILSQIWSAYQDSNQQQQKSKVSRVVGYCECIFKIFKNMNEKYGFRQQLLYPIENQVINFITVGYLADKYDKFYQNSGFLSKLAYISQQCFSREAPQRVQLNFIDSFLPKYVSFNIQQLLKLTLQYLYSKCFDTISQPLKTQFSCHEEQKKSYIKVDYIINMFNQYHNFFDLIHHKHSDLILSIFTDDILRDCIKYLHEMGIGWVIRKLQNWNSQEAENVCNQAQNNVEQNQNYHSPNQRQQKIVECNYNYQSQIVTIQDENQLNNSLPQINHDNNSNIIINNDGQLQNQQQAHQQNNQYHQNHGSNQNMQVSKQAQQVQVLQNENKNQMITDCTNQINYHDSTQIYKIGNQINQGNEPKNQAEADGKDLKQYEELNNNM